jgi:hypothetical protein
MGRRRGYVSDCTFIGLPVAFTCHVENLVWEQEPIDPWGLPVSPDDVTRERHT